MEKMTKKEKKENEKNMQQAQQEINSVQKEETKSEKGHKNEQKEKVNGNVEQEKDNKVTTEETKSLKKEKSDKEKLEELNDKYLRLAAEYDNYRRRTLKEKIELSKSAGEDVLVNILPVMDDFERGLVSIDKAKELDAIKEGLLLIYNKFKEFLKQRGVKEIEALEQDFDTDVHEAVTKIPAPREELKGKIVDVIEKGYLLNDKVIRYAKVVIGE
ncbi:MAG TPA: nucleotide exchange factor GrpE [Bacteroidales bacterium]|nr:nucleotide exchange factor GrpE [Bacteroidales bacterium]